MADKTIDQLTDGSPAQSADEVPIKRSGTASALRVTAGEIAALAGAPVTGLVTNVTGNTISTTTLTSTGATISGLSVAVAAGSFYRIEAWLMHSQSVAGGIGFGFEFPAMTDAAGQTLGGNSVGNQAIGTILSTMRSWGIFNQGNSNAIVYTTSAAAGANVFSQLQMVCAPSASGSIHVKARVSVASLLLVIKPGSFIQAFKLA